VQPLQPEFIPQEKIVADNRVKIPTKAITMRFPLDVANQLIELSHEHNMPKVQVLNTLVRDAYKRTMTKEKRRAV
jgi:hypothetical protein